MKISSLNQHSLGTYFLPGTLQDPLEKEMETHSSILAWRIPWTEDPMERGAWWAIVCSVTKNWTRLKQLSMYAPLVMQCTKSSQTCLLLFRKLILSKCFLNVFLGVPAVSPRRQYIKKILRNLLTESECLGKGSRMPGGGICIFSKVPDEFHVH